MFAAGAPVVLPSAVARAAMNTKEFLEFVLGDTGYYCAVGLKDVGLKDKKRVQKFFGSVDELISVAENLSEEGFDSYFALATFVTGESRTNGNVSKLKSFFFDLDCGPTKSYASQQDALADLRSFCKTLRLPKPTLVNSGNGIHVYWALTQAIDRDTWLPVAERLKALCRENNLKIDPAVTADSARILRVPGTKNYKNEEPKSVQIIGTAGSLVDLKIFKELLGEEYIPEPRKYEPRIADSVMSALSGSYVSRFRTIMMKSAAGNGCAQLIHSVTNQESVDEVLWRATLSIAAFCEDKSKAIHKVSEKHPEYAPEETEYKASMIKGPYTCAKFNEFRPDVCPSCKHWNKIKSPIVLGREVVEATEEESVVVEKLMDIPSAAPQTFVIPKYPEPYLRGRGGGVFKKVKVGSGEDEETKEVPVYHNDLYVTRRIRDPEVGECIVMRLHLPKDGIREFTVPLTAVGAKDEFRKHLSAQGVAVMKMEELMAYVNRWINDLQYKVTADEARRQFGWVNDDPFKGMESFVLGNMEIYKDRIDVNSPSSKTIDLFPAFAPKGTLDEWKENMKFWDRPGVEMHQYIVGTSFGAPLMAFFESINGAVFHVHSKDSGLGKTTAMFAGASVWGDPDRLVLQERDTFNSKMNRAETYKNLVVYLDEMTNSMPKDLSDFAYQVPSGQQKNRLGPRGNVERHRGLPWKTLFVTNGNTSMLERINLYKAMPKAEAQRILESSATSVSFSSKEETDDFSRRIMRCYGHAGVVYIQYLLNNKEAVWQLVLNTQKRIDEEAGLTKENRFWSAQVAATIAGLVLAKKAKLIDWQVGPIVKWVISAMENAREDMRTMGSDVESILTDYWAENYNNFLRIKSTDDARKGPIGLDHLIQPEASPRFALVARYEYDIKRLFLLPKPLKEWCGKHQINYNGLVEGLKIGRTKAKRESARLGKGTHINLPPKDVLIIDCSAFVDDETEDTIAAKAVLSETKRATAVS